MSDFKIDKKIPTPNTPALFRNRYPFGKMEVGDSFSLPADELLQARSAASWYGRRNDKKFTIRRYNDGYRCWRVE